MRKKNVVLYFFIDIQKKSEENNQMQLQKHYVKNQSRQHNKEITENVKWNLYIVTYEEEEEKIIINSKNKIL